MDHIVFLDRATIGEGVRLRAPSFEHQWTDYERTSPEQTFDRAKDAHFIITNKVLFDRPLLTRLPRLKHIAIAATGTNCVDLQAARDCGVSVSNVPGYATSSVAEHVLAMILGLRRNLKAYQGDIEKGQWQASQQFCFHNEPMHDLVNNTLGLVGTGAIAQQVAQVAKALGMRIVFHSVSGREECDGGILLSLEALLSCSDVVSLHCPLTPETENLINEHSIKSMKPNALLINTARGPIVDLEALYHALCDAEIAGAGIDVAPVEPPPKDSAIMKLNQLNNCIVTPHTAWASIEAMQQLMNQVVRNIDAAEQGQMLNVVNT